MTTTMQAISDRDGHPDQLVVAGEVLDMRYVGKPLSLRAGKLLHLLVNAAGVRACDDERHSMAIEDLNRHFHLSVEGLVDTCRELFATQIRLEYQSPKGRRLKIGPMLADAERDLDASDDDPAILSWRFSEVLQMVLRNSTHWAALSRKAVLALEGRYSLRLYEIVALRKGLSFVSEQDFLIDDLRARLGVEPGKLKAWIHLRQRALDPAVAEVRQLTGLDVSYTLIKRGRRVAGISLKWSERDREGRSAVARELEGSRVGRRARREGTVEQVVAPEGDDVPMRFPENAYIRGTPFEWIAKHNLPEPARDIDQVADEFLAWAKKQGIPLHKKTITEIFATFCSKQRPARSQ
jgi:hypothetical protein